MNDLSRFFYCKSTEIQSLINNGTINAWDFAIVSDNNKYKLVVITDDLRRITFNDTPDGSIKIFESLFEADQALETASDIRAGEIICINQNGEYIPYIIQLANDTYYLKPFVSSDYEALINKPSIGHVELSGDLSFSNLGLEQISNIELEALLT